MVTWLPDCSWFLGCGLGFAIDLVRADRYDVAERSDVTASPADEQTGAAPA